jgi:hypothetical protein
MKRTSLWLAASLFLFVACPGLEYVHGSERAKYVTMLESQVKDSQFVTFLRKRPEKALIFLTAPNFLKRITMH